MGLSTFALQQAFPHATITGLDFSSYYLAVAFHEADRRRIGIRHWRHALPEATGLAAVSIDLVSACLLLHEMPQDSTRRILREARRVLRPGGCLAIMDMNTDCDAYQTMPAALMTLLKSTEPYLDQYIALDLLTELQHAGFDQVTSAICCPRHRAVVARTSL